MSLVSSLSIAQQALSVNQAALSVISNNIANVDNKNYSKLSVNLEDVVNYTKLTDSATQESNTLNGVKLAKITRSSNDYLETYYRGENSTNSYYKEYSTIASSIEGVMNELNDTGLSDALSKFYDAAGALSDDPTDVTARQNYLSCAENVCSVFNSVYESLQTQQTDLVGEYNVKGSCDTAEIGTSIEEVNNLLDHIAEVNKSIVQTNSTGSSASAMLDTRDSLLEELSTYMPINTTINDNGTADVSLGNYSLVRGSSVKGHLDVTNVGATSDAPVSINIVDPEDSTTTLYPSVEDNIDSGSIGAILTVTGASTSSDLTVNSVIANVNLLASTFASTLNSIQSGSITSGGTTTYAMCLNSTYTATQQSNESLFLNSDTSTTAGITAENISINSNLKNNLYLIAAARSTSTTSSSNIGDNSNMTLVAATQTNTNATLGNQTFSNYLASEVASIGSTSESLSNSLETQGDVLDSIQSQISSQTGVNLDEELGELIKFQQAYQAAARVFSVCSSLMEELMNLGK